MRALTAFRSRWAGVKRQVEAVVRARSAKGSTPSTTVALETDPSFSTTNSSNTEASPVAPSGYGTSVLLVATGGSNSGVATGGGNSEVGWAIALSHVSNAARHTPAARGRVNIRWLCPVFTRRPRFLHSITIVVGGPLQRAIRCKDRMDVTRSVEASVIECAMPRYWVAHSRVNS